MAKHPAPTRRTAAELVYSLVPGTLSVMCTAAVLVVVAAATAWARRQPSEMPQILLIVSTCFVGALLCVALLFGAALVGTAIDWPSLAAWLVGLLSLVVAALICAKTLTPSSAAHSILLAVSAVVIIAVRPHLP